MAELTKAPRQDMPSGRTSTLEPPANDLFAIHPASSGKRPHWPCLPFRERKLGDQTKDDIDKEPREERFCGRSQTSLYNATRRHSTIGYLSRVEFERKVGFYPGVHQTGSSSYRRSHLQPQSTLPGYAPGGLSKPHFFRSGETFRTDIPNPVISRRKTSASLTKSCTTTDTCVPFKGIYFP
jgi:hypothetical protein